MGYQLTFRLTLGSSIVMPAQALKKKGVDGRVKHGHDGVGGWVIGHDGGYKISLQKKK
jgi:hypothetical protein